MNDRPSPIVVDEVAWPSKGRKRRVDHDRVRELGELGWSPDRIAPEVGCTPLYIRQILKGITGDGCDQTQSRFASRPLFGRGSPGMPPFDHPAISDGRTMFPSRVITPDDDVQLFKSGHNSTKIGKHITKGRWKGFEIYTLTLEERATCPQSCKHWRSCYGNNMQMAQRFAHGDLLETKIVYEVAALAKRHPNGFAVRLHVLGDFYSVRYVRLWSILLDECPQLHVFGFTARWSDTDPVAHELSELSRKRWQRFAIRFSNAPMSERSTISIEHPYQKPADAIICPQQMGKTTACATCALCWQSKKRIAFVQH